MSRRRCIVTLAFVAALVGAAVLLAPDKSEWGLGNPLNTGAVADGDSSHPALDNTAAPPSKSHRETRTRTPTPNEILREKLDKIIIPSIDFEDITLIEARDFLRSRSRELDASTTDPSARGIHYVIRPHQTDANPAENGAPDESTRALQNRTIKHLRASNLTSLEALDLICAQTGTAWKIKGGQVILFPVVPDPE